MDSFGDFLSRTIGENKCGPYDYVVQRDCNNSTYYVDGLALEHEIIVEEQNLSEIICFVCARGILYLEIIWLLKTLNIISMFILYIVKTNNTKVSILP